VLFNVPREAAAKDVWNKLGSLYETKSMVSKLCLQKKLYSLKINDGNYMEEHINAFNTTS